MEFCSCYFYHRPRSKAKYAFANIAFRWHFWTAKWISVPVWTVESQWLSASQKLGSAQPIRDAEPVYTEEEEEGGRGRHTNLAEIPTISMSAEASPARTASSTIGALKLIAINYNWELHEVRV